MRKNIILLVELYLKVIAVLKVPRKIADKIVYATSIHNDMDANSTLYFPSPSPTLLVFDGHIQDLVKAESDVKARKLGAAEFRDSKLRLVLTDMDHLRDYVQGIADVNHGIAETIIKAAGMSVKKVTAKTKPEIKVTSQLSTTAYVVAKAAGRGAFYEWQKSTDGVTWTTFDSSNSAHITATGLTPVVKYYFRFRSTIKDVHSNWSLVYDYVAT